MDNDFPVPGEPIENTSYHDRKEDILIRARELCGWKRATFPGSQPVSLSSTNITELGKTAYVACEKTDGVRYLLLAVSNMALLIDRKETVRVVRMCLPTPQEALDKTKTAVIPVERLQRHHLTLLDGELVQDTMSETDKRVSFLIYDVISIQRDKDVAKLNLMERLRLAWTKICKPRHQFEELYPDAVGYEKSTQNHMPIFLKDFFEVWDVMAIRNYSSKRLPHLCDGIIFTPVALPYVPGTCKSLMKWKPPELNTVDFAAELLYSHDIEGWKVPVAARLLIGHKGFRADSGCWATIGQGDMWKTMIEREKKFNDCDGTIWECYFDPNATTIIPFVAQVDSERGACRKALSTWDSFWLQKVGQKRKAEEDFDAVHKRKRGRFVRTIVEPLLMELDPSQSLEGVHPAIGKFPVTDLPGFPDDVCPILTDRAGTVYFDYSRTELRDGGWVLERIRTDKTTPNDERVMQRVKESIDAGIDYTVLFNTLLSYRKNGVKPVHSYCTMPPYYAEHGSRTQSGNMEAYEAQQKAAEAAMAATLAEVQNRVAGGTSQTAASEEALGGGGAFDAFEAAMLDELSKQTHAGISAPAEVTVNGVMDEIEQGLAEGGVEDEDEDDSDSESSAGGKDSSSEESD